MDYVSRPFKNLDIIVITFEGVLGAFMPPLPADYQVMDPLLLRPGIAQALTDLLNNFKVVIITGDQSSLH